MEAAAKLWVSLYDGPEPCHEHFSCAQQHRGAASPFASSEPRTPPALGMLAIAIHSAIKGLKKFALASEEMRLFE